MPIGSYPRITLNETTTTNNPASGTGLAIYNYNTDTYAIADSDLFPINGGGLASNNSVYDVYSALKSNENVSVANLLTSSLGPKISDLLYDNNTDTSAGDILGNILTILNIIQSNFANGTYAIQIKSGSSSNIADVGSDRKLKVSAV